MSEPTFHLADEDATEQFGRTLARLLEPGDVLALVGDLGAGKTRLVRAIARGLDVAESIVTSPTFTLIHEYAGRFPIRHCDAYRLKQPGEFAALGLDDLFAEDGVAIVEWADRVMDDLPKDRLEIHITATGPTERSVTLIATGFRGSVLHDALLVTIWFEEDAEDSASSVPE
ncbi:MAG TPA: tRNA (adenosine(37)-N6)-threonylcarbamoyltransferase complex ATPase subunit type 1 TsaE [Planctomycetaceae bacterium]|nr:tRNA (adenosine(37)-N6)-threonylcarbamoyltransferase complex ATPase subunit type 1 TsaE [Planctomycetaceae bacterium]